MTRTELITHARVAFLDDSVVPYLWPDTLLNAFLDEAIIQACRRSVQYRRVYSGKIKANFADYVLDPSVVEISSFLYGPDAIPLQKTTEFYLESEFGPLWRNAIAPLPSFYLQKGNTVRLIPIPTENSTYGYSSSNIPDENFDFDEDFNPSYRMDLLSWIAYRAYSVPDHERYNTNTATFYLQEFDKSFGVLRSAKLDEARKRLGSRPRIPRARLF